MKTVLIIEDNFEIRENTAEMLELEGYAVLEAANGKLGLEMAKAKLPDIILCDVMMPEMDGYEVLTHLKKDNNISGIPFIFLSANTEKKDMKTGMDLGACGYLNKPFTLQELVKELERCLSK